jgi:hypothetical protein
VDIRPHLDALALPGVVAAIPRGDSALDSSDGVVFLPKPFTRKELARALEEALRSRTPGSGGSES